VFKLFKISGHYWVFMDALLALTLSWTWRRDTGWIVTLRDNIGLWLRAAGLKRGVCDLCSQEDVFEGVFPWALVTNTVRFRQPRCLDLTREFLNLLTLHGSSINDMDQCKQIAYCCSGQTTFVIAFEVIFNAEFLCEPRETTHKAQLNWRKKQNPRQIPSREEKVRKKPDVIRGSKVLGRIFGFPRPLVFLTFIWVQQSILHWYNCY